VARSCCRRCYDRRRRSDAYFGGYRELVLTRDGCCQVCLALERLVVHHRRPGKDKPTLQIALCRRCHVRIHRRYQLPGSYEELFFTLWQEQHPGWPAQLRLPLVT
jgi:5-methylcytosine-specific restriction endonuclease McrA